MNSLLNLITLICASTILFVSCDTEPDTFTATGDESYFAPSGSDPIQFQVDSVIFDPSIGGTAKIASSSIWTLELIDDAIDSKPYYVTVKNGSGDTTAVQRYIWDFSSAGLSNGRKMSSLDGFNYVSLVTPFTAQSTWNALQNADPSLEIAVAGEPLRIHKDWTTAVIDSIGTYALPDGSSVEAVYVNLTSAENAIELREFKEVYAKGLGLLERSQRFLDTQQSSSTELWEDKAENGFTVTMKRLF